MSNLRLLIKNLWDECQLSVLTGTPVSSLPLAHSQYYGRSKTAAIVPAAHQSVLGFNHPDLVMASGMVLYRHWLSNIAQWRLELFDEPNYAGTCVYDSGLQECVLTKSLGELDWLVDPLVTGVFDDWPHRYSQLWFDEVFFQSGRITLVDSDARDGLHEFDRLYLGAAFTPKFNFSYGFEHQWISAEAQRKTAAGSTFSPHRPQRRQLSFDLEFLTGHERARLSSAIRAVGISKDFFVSLYPNAGGQKEVEYAMACFLTEAPGLIGEYFDNYAASLTLQEA